MKINFKHPNFYFIIACLVVSLMINSYCVKDPDCEPDPVRNNCSSSCSFDNFQYLKFFLSALGLYVFGHVGRSILDGEFGKDNKDN